MKTLTYTALALALAGAFPSLASAQSNEELLQQLKELKARVTDLESKLAAPTPPNPQWGMTPEQVQEFNRISVKTEALEDNQEANGFKDLKFSGYMDPSYIYNVDQKRAGFQFLNPVAEDGYNYDNSYFGTLSLDFQKELEGGTKWRVTLMPSRGAGSVADPASNSIVHEASVSIPLGDLQTRFIAGQIPDWSGYEYIQPTTTKLVTRGLLLDFTEPTAYTAAGMEIIRGKWDVKWVAGSFNTTLQSPNHRSPVFAYRADYSKGEYAGFGFAGVEGRTANFADCPNDYCHTSWLDLFEADAYFIRGDLTLQGQVGFGRQKKASIIPAADRSLRDAQWFGLSGLAAYKFQPRLEGAVRLDYINNQKNGGGLLGYTGYYDPTNGIGGDYRNGIGVSPDCLAGADPSGCKGANRVALAVGLNYALTENAMLKAEYRFDSASQAVFENVSNGSYKKTNSLLGTSVVVSF
jgi:opacity protein-like surface antigen